MPTDILEMEATRAGHTGGPQRHVYREYVKKSAAVGLRTEPKTRRHGKRTAYQWYTAQSSYVGSRYIRSIAAMATRHPIDELSLWTVVRDGAQDVGRRSLYFAELIARGDTGVPGYLVAELPIAAENPPWRNELIFAAEHIEVVIDADRQSLAQSLLMAAKQIRSAINPEAPQALCAALRRYASIVPPSMAHHLVEFLTPNDDLITKQVALDGVWQIFLQRPPTEAMLHKDLASLSDRVAELASKYTDMDWLTPGENTALALKAIQASAALLNPNLPRLSERLVGFGKPRLLRGIAPGLRRLLDNWRKANVSEGSLPVILLLRSLSVLQSA